MMKVEAFMSIDGFLSTSRREVAKHDALKMNLSFECPQCKGHGVFGFERLTRHVPDGYGGFGAYMNEEYNGDPLPCSVCSGIGFTAKELKPITETKITGYK